MCICVSAHTFIHFLLSVLSKGVCVVLLSGYVWQMTNSLSIACFLLKMCGGFSMQNIDSYTWRISKAVKSLLEASLNALKTFIKLKF